MRLFRAFSLLLLVTGYSLAATPDRITGAIDASQVVQLTRSRHPKAQPQYDRGAVDPQTRLDYVTLLTTPSPSQQKALDQLLADQQNPSSPSYHQWLTSEQFADRFGLSQNDINKITAWLKAAGLTVVDVARGRNWVVFSGTVGQISAALHTEIHRYNIKGETHFANATPVSVPAAFAGTVVAFRGLHDFRLRPMGVRKRPHPAFYDSVFNFNFLAPGDLKMIYDLKPLYDAGMDGTGQKLVVVGQTDVFLADLNDFRSGFGLSTISGCTTNSNGVITACGSGGALGYVAVGTDPGTPFSGDLEESDLDLEWSGAVARGAQIIFVTAPSATGTVSDALYNAIDATPPYAPVISMSYGLCELAEVQGGTLVADETELKKANSKGITVVNSSGDIGAATCDNFTNSSTTPPNLAVNGLAVGYPASSQYVTSVGGTAVPFLDLTTNAGIYWSTSNTINGTDGGSALGPVPEQVWSDTLEFAQYCQANTTNKFCTQGGVPAQTGWVSITSEFAAQEDLGIGGGGGGASNCTAVDGTGKCIPDGTNGTNLGFPQPVWQTVTVSGQPSARFVPDVSLLATPNWPGFILCTPLEELVNFDPTNIYINTFSSSCQGGITAAVEGVSTGNVDTSIPPSIIGGTSASAPAFAGIIAVLNQYLGNTNGMGNANPMLYQLAAVAPGAFNDITSGDNTVYCKQGTPTTQPAALQCPAPVLPDTHSKFGYSAGAGYDLATGLGSVNVNNLAIAWKTPPDFTVGSSGPITVYAGQSGTATITVTPINSFGSVVAFSCSGLPTGASCSFNPPTVTAPTTSIMTVQTTGTEAAGTTTFSVAGTTGVLSQVSHTTSQSITVQEPDFTLSLSGGGAPVVLAGQTATYSFTANPTAPTTFTTAVTFSCSFSPADSTLTNSCSATAVPAGNGSTSVTLSIKTAGPNSGTVAAIQHRADQRSPWLPLALPIAGLVLAGLAGRKVSKYSVVAGLCVSLAMAGLMLACGGGSSSPPPISVTVSPGTAVNLYANEAGNSWPANLTQQKFSATVNNDTNQTVTWAVPGSPANGTIDSTGVYTAPATVPNPASVTVTATSADATGPGTGHVNLLTPTAVGTFTVTVTATEGLRTHAPSQPVTLTVQ